MSVGARVSPLRGLAGGDQDSPVTAASESAGLAGVVPQVVDVHTVTHGGGLSDGVAVSRAGGRGPGPTCEPNAGPQGNGSEAPSVPVLSFGRPSREGEPPEILAHGSHAGLVSCPVHREPPMVVLRDRRDVVSCLKRSDAFGFAGVPEGFALTGAELQDPDGGLLRCDDPKFGRAIRPIFSARRVEGSRPRVQALASALIAKLEPDDACVFDFKVYSHAFVAHAVCAALGVPLTTWEFILRSSRLAFGVIENEAQAAEAATAWQEAVCVLRGVVRAKRAQPDDAIISQVIDAFDARGFSQRQAVRTIATISNGFPAALPVLDVSMLELLTRCGLVDDCLRAPELWRDVVAECMRHRAMFPVALPRCARRDVRIGDRVIPAGTVVLPSLLAAAHDPVHTPDPDQFVPRRDKAQTNIVFGAGSHFCSWRRPHRPVARDLATSVLPTIPASTPHPAVNAAMAKRHTIHPEGDQPPGATRHQHQHAAPASARPGARNPRSKPRAQETTGALTR